MASAKWYSHNFSNEQILQGQQTQFLRFKNLTDKIGSGKPLYFYVIPEIINIDPVNDTDYAGHVFLNGADIFEMNAIFKNTNNLDPEFATPLDVVSNPVNSNNDRVFSIVGTANDFSIGGVTEEEFGFRFPKTDKVKLNPTTGTRFWGSIPLNNGKGAKNNYRIDYTGNKDLVVKLTFVITTIPPNVNLTNDWDDYPALGTTTTPISVAREGDVRFNSPAWEYYDGATWNAFPAPYDTDGPWMGIKNLHDVGYFTPDNLSWTGAWVDFQEVYLFCYAKNNESTSRETDYWVDKKTYEKPVNDAQNSHMLLRTNPKLSGNIKLVVDSGGSMYLESIDANEELSNAKFKKNKISPRGSFAVDVNKYFSSLTPEVMYQVAQRDTEYLNSKRTFAEQYDFFYGYGVSELNSKYYDEEFSIFAPIWVRKKLPDFFVIFKANGPVNLKTYSGGSQEEILADLMSNAKILKTFDMRDGSNIGQYLRNVVNDPRFVEQPLRISYEKETLSTWHGVSYREGVLGSKGEFLYDFFRTDKTINEAEEYITRGFERNGIISTNLFNMEFLFDDTEAGEYEINRYFGLYVNEIELAQFELYGDAFYKITGQSPQPKKNVDAEPYSLKSFNQTNPNGIVIPIDYFHGPNPAGQPDHTGRVIGKLPMIESVEDPFRVFYVRDRDDNIDRIKEIQEYQFNNPGDPNFIRFTGIHLYDTTADLSKYAGITKMMAQLEAELLPKGHAQLVVDIKDVFNENNPFLAGEILEIEWIDINMNKQLWRLVANPTGLQQGDFWDFPLYNPDEYLYINTFNPEGSPEEVAKAIGGCINFFNNRLVTAYVDGSRIYLRANLAGHAGNGFVFRRILETSSVINNIEFYGIQPDYSPTFEAETTINVLTTGDFQLNEIISGGRANEYSVEVIALPTPNSITVEIRKNGGLIATHSWNLLVTIIPFTNGNITVTPDISGGSVYTINDLWKFKSTTNKIEQRFIGGNNRNRNRALIKTTDAVNISSEYWYQSQKAKYSRLKTWDVQGNNLFVLPNLEDPILVNDQLTGYENLTDMSIIEMDDADFEFYITEERRIMAFDAFEPTIGLMSFLHVKDFDFDWIRSDYAYTPNAEVFHYYEKYELKSGEEVEISLFTDYKVLSGSIELYGFNTSTQTWDLISGTINASSNPEFNTYLPSYEYNSTSASGTVRTPSGPNATETNYFFRNYLAMLSLSTYNKIKAVCLVDTEVIKNSYRLDNDLSGFNGFLGISDFFSQEDEKALQKLIEENDINRYFFDQLLSEYDRLRENFVKDYAVKSRVVPYINKWTHKGTDCRDNPYRLNNSLAFGVTGFSPDTQIKERNPRLHTHEFYYLDKFPEGYPSELFANSRSYFFHNLSDEVVNYNGNDYSWYQLLKDNSQDWFSKYFTLGYPTELNLDGEKVIKKTEERYVYTDFIEGINEVQGIFRGGKFSISEIDKITNTVISGSTKYQGYKFSSILRILPLSFTSNEPPTTIEFIANDIHKTIVMVITLYVNDYRVKEGKYGYAFLYTASSALRNTDAYSSEQTFDPSTDYLELSKYHHYNGLSGALIVDYADVKLNGVFDFVGISPATNPRTVPVESNTAAEFNPVEEILAVTGDDYDKELKFNPDASSVSNFLIGVMERGDYSEISQFYPNTVRREIVNHQSEEGLSIDTTTSDVSFNGSIFAPATYYTAAIVTSFTVWPSRQVYGSIPSVAIDADTNAWYLSGGEGYLKNRLEEISFAAIFERINNDRDVDYFTIDGSGINKGYFKFSFIDFDRIEKQNRLQVTEDTDKPDVYKEKEVVGFNVYDPAEEVIVMKNKESGKVVTKKLVEAAENEVVFRHRGRFEPKTRKVFNFWVREDQVMSDHYNKDFLLANTRWGVEYNYFGELQNLFYSKVADQEIMKISSGSKYKSLYPLLNELAINNKDFFVFSSNWDNNYYDKYNDLSLSEPSEGTLELYEQKSFLGSKVMNVPNKFTLDTFLSSEVTYEVTEPLLSTDVSSIKKNVSNKGATLDNAAKAKLIINIDAASRLIREMLENNAALEFTKLKQLGYTRFATLTNEQLEAEVRTYLIDNILPLYKVSDVSLYFKDPADENVDTIFRIDLTETAKRLNNYKRSKNTKVDMLSTFNYLITEELDTKKYKAYSISITLERI